MRRLREARLDKNSKAFQVTAFLGDSWEVCTAWRYVTSWKAIWFKAHSKHKHPFLPHFMSIQGLLKLLLHVTWNRRWQKLSCLQLGWGTPPQQTDLHSVWLQFQHLVSWFCPSLNAVQAAYTYSCTDLHRGRDVCNKNVCWQVYKRE